MCGLEMAGSVGSLVVTEPSVRYFEDLVVGEEEWGIEEVAVEEDMIDYAIRYDPWPHHVDADAARETPFGGLIASSGYSIQPLVFVRRSWRLEPSG